MTLFEQASLVVTPNGFKAGKLYSIKPVTGAGDFDVVRATGATRVNANGLIETVGNNVPRIDYPPLGGCPSILVEPASTNKFLYSQDFSQEWFVVNIDKSNNFGIAPDGTQTATKIEMQSGTSRFEQGSPQDFDNNADVTISAFFKVIDASNDFQMRIRSKSGVSLNCLFDLNALTVTPDSGVTGKIIPYPNGWFRCVTTANIGEGGDTGLHRIINTSNEGDQYLIWGAQLEVGSVATSYIPTVASTVTRNADSINKTGISSLIGQTEGTLYAEVDVSNAVVGDILTIDNGTVNDFISFRKLADFRIRVSVKKESSSSVNIITSGFFSTGLHKIALGYKNGDYALYIDGISEGTSTNSSDYPEKTLTRFNLSNTIISGIFNDHIKAAALLPTRLSNAQLASLTTL